MGGKESKLKEKFLFAIVANKEGEVVNFLKVNKTKLMIVLEIP